MRKRLLAIVICAVLVSTLAATSAVSAKPAGKSNIQQYDLLWGSVVVGKLTINTETGHYVANVNYAAAGLKDGLKAYFREYPMKLFLQVRHIGVSPNVVTIGLGTSNNGGNLHAEGTITGVDLQAISHEFWDGSWVYWYLD